MALNWFSGLFGKKKYVEKTKVNVEEPADSDAWVKAEDGENTFVEGEPSEAEKKYNLLNTVSKEAKTNPKYLDRTDLIFPNEHITMEIAGAWGFNPQALEEINTISERPGIIGIFNAASWE